MNENRNADALNLTKVGFVANLIGFSAIACGLVYLGRQGLSLIVLGVIVVALIAITFMYLKKVDPKRSGLILTAGTSFFAWFLCSAVAGHEVYGIRVAIITLAVLVVIAMILHCVTTGVRGVIGVIIAFISDFKVDAEERANLKRQVVLSVLPMLNTFSYVTLGGVVGICSTIGV